MQNKNQQNKNSTKFQAYISALKALESSAFWGSLQVMLHIFYL